MYIYAYVQAVGGHDRFLWTLFYGRCLLFLSGKGSQRLNIFLIIAFIFEIIM